jgi:hypothetical protein
MPAVVAVEHGDRFKPVTGDYNDSAEAIQSCAWMPAWLADHFVEAWRSPKFTVYTRNGAAMATIGSGE